MTADFPIVLDACVLANFGVCDLFLRLAEAAPLDRAALVRGDPRRSPAHPVGEAESGMAGEVVVLVEAGGHPGLSPDAVVTGYEPFIPVLTNDEQDRHVLAAAIKASVSVIVTFNLRHFPASALQAWKVDAVHPQDYLLTLYSMNPAVVMAKLGAISRDRTAELEDTLIHLGKSLPRFARQILDDMGEPGGPLGRLSTPPE